VSEIAEQSFTIHPHWCWRNIDTGRVVSVHDEQPCGVDDKDSPWTPITDGYVLRNPYSGQYVREPFQTKEDAQAFADIVVAPRIAFA
jgi:hypothetical protein